MNLKDKIIAITGGTKGLGKAMAELLTSKGAKAFTCSSKDYDVTDEKALTTFAEKIGHIDLWINNAGVWLPPESIESLDMEKARQLVNINLFGTINGTRVAVRQMKKQGNGTIMNIISTTAFDGMNGSSGAMYVATKYALRGFTNVIREELKPSNIDVIGVYPGGFKSGIFDAAVPANFDHFMDVTEVAQKIVANLELDKPELQLVIKRPGQKGPASTDSAGHDFAKSNELK
jgi:NAD(P)-dependent dehydrogenase (short-subunit alcohol dehydrogenase family)